jgi:hypothetical protein
VLRALREVWSGAEAVPSPVAADPVAAQGDGAAG